jgi:nitrate/nitrite-specific signal transduction histidine kinase
VTDDGCGFDAGQCSGHGLRNMAERARALDGSLEVISRPGYGTHLALHVSLGRSLRPRGHRIFPHKHAGPPVTQAP